MRTILAAILVVGLAACRTVTIVQEPSPSATPNAPGAANHRAAVDAFFAAVRSGDLQAAGSVWGSKDGAARDLMGRDEMERRLLIIQCYLAHQNMRVIGSPRTKGDSAFYRVELVQTARTQQTDVITVQGPRSRWFVADPKIAGLVAPSCGAR
jgi:hypothetical protein